MTITTSATNIRWGDTLTDQFDVTLHPTRDAGGNPLLIWRHTGGGTSQSKSQAWDGSQLEVEYLFNYLLSPNRAVHFDIVSVETEQALFDGTTQARGRVTFVPEAVISLQRAIRGVRRAMRVYGTDDSKTFLMGSSHGAWLSMMALLQQPMLVKDNRVGMRSHLYEYGMLGQPIAGAIMHTLAYPDFRRLCTASGLSIVGASVSGTTVTKTNAFNTYRFVTGDQIVLVVGGTPTTYTVSGKTDNSNITLVTAPAAGTYSGYISSDQNDLVWTGMLFGTKQSGTDAGGVKLYAEWDALPAAMKAEVSLQYWAEQRDVSQLPQLLFVNYKYGDGVHPYGKESGAPSDVHDYRGAVELASAISSAGGTTQTILTEDPTISDWSSGRRPSEVYDWLVSAIANNKTPLAKEY